MERAEEKMDNVVEAMVEFLNTTNEIEEFEPCVAAKPFLQVALKSHLMRLFKTTEKEAYRAVKQFIR